MADARDDAQGTEAGNPENIGTGAIIYSPYLRPEKLTSNVA
jgi:hypothetical protein